MKKVWGETTGSRLAETVYGDIRKGKHRTLSDYKDGER